jgi:hypothetical protein
MFSFIFSYYRKSTARYFAHNTLAKSLTAFAFLLVLGFFAVVVHEGFYYGFRYLVRDPFFGEMLSLYIIELFLLVSSFLAFASALLSGVTGLYRNDSMTMVVASPAYQLKPIIAMLRMFFSSLWPLLLVIVPALLAIVRVFALSIFGMLSALLASVVLSLLAVLCALLVIFLVSFILGRMRRFSMRSLFGGVGGVFALLLFVIWSRFHAVNLVIFFQARLLAKATPDLTPIIEQFHIFPSHFVALTILSGEQGDMVGGVFALLSLIFLAVLSFGLLILVSRRYLTFWQIAQEHGKGGAMHARSPLSLSASSRGALFTKERLLFLRNGRGILWMLFILMIWGMQSGSSRLLTHGLGADRVSGGALPGATAAFQFALATYFVSMLALRFAFPSFSEEKKFMWVTETAPLAKLGIFRAKLTFFASIFTSLAVLFTFLNASITAIDLAKYPTLIVLIVTASIAITVYALVLGVLFPNDETDDPEVLSTSLPGLLFIIVSLIYGALGAIVFRDYIVSGGYLYIALFEIASLLAMGSLLALAQKKFER